MSEKKMVLNKKDIPYLIIAIGLAGIAAVAVGNPDSPIGLYGLVGLFGIAMLMAILLYPNLGANVLVITIFTNISRELTDRGLPGITKPLVVVVFMAILVRNYFAGQIPVNRPKTSRIETFLIMYLFAVAATFLVAANKDRALEGIIDVGKDTIIVYCILFALRRPAFWKQTIWVIILATAVACSAGVYQTVTGNNDPNLFFGLSRVTMTGDSFGLRHGGPINEANMWAQVVAAVIVLVIFRIIHEPRKLVKIFSVTILAIMLFELLNTYSRGGYLALSVGVILTLFVFEKSFNPMIAFAVLGLIILLLPFLPATYLDRFSTLSSLSPATENGIHQDSSFVGRTSEVRAGLMMFASHPLLGVGVGNYLNNYQTYARLIGLEYRTEEREPHSLYVQVLAESGVIGAVPFMGIIVSLFIGLSRIKKDIKNSPYDEAWSPYVNSIVVSLITYLFAALFLHGAFIRYFWILAAMGITAIQLTDELLIRYKQSAQVEAL